MLSQGVDREAEWAIDLLLLRNEAIDCTEIGRTDRQKQKEFCDAASRSVQRGCTARDVGALDSDGQRARPASADRAARLRTELGCRESSPRAHRGSFAAEMIATLQAGGVCYYPGCTNSCVSGVNVRCFPHR